MPGIDGERTITVRLDSATVRDLEKLERHYRAGTSVVVRLVIAEQARRLGLSKEDEDTKQVA
jgi:hypothetical protein